MIGNLFTYNIIRTSLLIILIICGYSISTSQKKSNIQISIAIVIILFSLIEGLRWDRGPDYFNNYLMLTSSTSGIVKEEPLFLAIITILRDILHMPYWGSFIFYSFLYIYSFTLVVKKFPKAAVWALPVMFLTTVAAHENFIRQFIGVSFLLFAYNFYIKRQKGLTVLCLICVFNVHTSGLFALACFALIAITKPDLYIKKPIYLVLVYLAFYFLWDVSYLGDYTSYLENLDLGGVGAENMQGYVDNAERWFTEEGSISSLNGIELKASKIAIAIELIRNCTIIYFGLLAVRIDKRLRIPYWFCYIAILIFVIGGDIELIERLGWWLYIFMPIVLGAIWYTVPMNKKLKFSLSAFLILTYAYAYIMGLSKIPFSGCAFIWDR